MTQNLNLVVEEKASEEKIEQMESAGKTVSALNSYSQTGADIVTLGLNFLSLDFGGHLMKLSQMNKLFCRFRFLDINFGAYLGAYFDFSSKKFDPPSSKSSSAIAA